MVYAVGCIHPEGEADDYDGLYFKDCELGAMCAQLTGLPLCVEHIDDKPVGRVAHAWVGDDRRAYALFDTDGECARSIRARLRFAILCASSFFASSSRATASLNAGSCLTALIASVTALTNDGS